MCGCCGGCGGCGGCSWWLKCPRQVQLQATRLGRCVPRGRSMCTLVVATKCTTDLIIQSNTTNPEKTRTNKMVNPNIDQLVVANPLVAVTRPRQRYAIRSTLITRARQRVALMLWRRHRGAQGLLQQQQQPQQPGPVRQCVTMSQWLGIGEGALSKTMLPLSLFFLGLSVVCWREVSSIASFSSTSSTTTTTTAPNPNHK